MKAFIEEYGKTVVAVICVTLCITLMSLVFSGQLAPFLKHAYQAQEKISNNTAVGREGSKVGSNKDLSDKQKGETAKINFTNPLYEADTANADINGINLMIREKEYELPLATGGTYKFNGSEWYALNNTFQSYGIDSSSDERPWYILSLNPLSSGLASKDSTSRTTNAGDGTSFNDLTTVSFDFKSHDVRSKDFILLTFDKDASGKIKTDTNKKPIVKKYQEIVSLKYTKNDAKTLKALDSDFDVIIFKSPGLYRVRYFLQDKAGYSYYAYTKITVDNIYGIPEGSKYETLWKKV